MFWRKPDSDRPRRIFYTRNDGLGISPYLRIDEWRYGDDWRASGAKLRSIVGRKILAKQPSFSIGSISFHAVWDAIIPRIRPSHWLTCGYCVPSPRSQSPRSRSPIIQIPVVLGTDETAIEIGRDVFFAIGSLPIPATLEISQHDRAIFSFTILNALSITVRDRMR